MRWAYEHCWHKKRTDSKLTRSTYNKWIKNFKKRGHYAPKVPEADMSVKPWYSLLFALMKRPQGSVLTWVHEQIVAQWKPAWGDTPPSYDAVYRARRDKLSQSDLLKGRYTGSQLRSKKFYQHRTSEGLAPADEVHGDGWCTHFTFPHPETREFVTYEVWHFHDLATRFTTPPGIGMSEKFEVISKGLENFCRVFGQPLIVQMDSTKVVKGSDRFTKARESLEERLGCTIVHPVEVGNSQANGTPENFNTYYDKRSKELATYQGKDMDTLTYKRVRKITLKMTKAEGEDDYKKLKNEAERMGKGRVFDSMEEGVAWINRITDEANDNPHRSLKKVRDPATGRQRHQTPREALAEHLANGWEPLALEESQIVDIFRPHTLCKVSRETVSPYGGMRYKNSDLLSPWNGKEVIVAYDIHDYNQVWVKDMQGALICVAEFVAATGYRAQTAYDAAEEKRAKARIKLCENKIDTIKARSPSAALEGECERVETILNFLDLDTVQAKPEREMTILDFLPEDQEKAREPTYADTVMWLDEGKNDGEKPLKEVATGS